MNKKNTFASIDNAELTKVNGGAARVAATAKSGDVDSKLQLMLSQIGDSIKDVAKPKEDNGMMNMMMMMMMMGGGGGGASGAAAAAPPPPPPSGTYVKVNVRR